MVESKSPHFPRAFMSASREEMVNAKLTIKYGEGYTGSQSSESPKLPDDLQGHVFIISMAGTVASPSPKDPPEGAVPQSTVLPGGDGQTALFNGDGMVYRLDFHHVPGPNPGDGLTSDPGQAWLTCQLLKPPAFFADKITQQNPETWDDEYSYQNYGIARISRLLGPCHQINTALVPIKVSEARPPRLLATTDANRPYEIDPISLKIVAPIGQLPQAQHPSVWHPLDLSSGLFEMVLSAAHPCPAFSSINGQEKSEVFTLNVVKNWFDLTLHHIQPNNPGNKDKLYLIRWSISSEEKDKFETWEVLHYDHDKHQEQSIQILQSSHMLGLTENYLILSDTAMKLDGIDLLFPLILRLFSHLLSLIHLSPDDFKTTLHEAIQTVRLLKDHLHHQKISPTAAIEFLGRLRNQLKHILLDSPISRQAIQLIFKDLEIVLKADDSASRLDPFTNYTQYLKLGEDISREVVDSIIKQIRLVLVSKQNVDTIFYIVKRSDLESFQAQSTKKIHAKRAIIKNASEHYLTDFKETDAGEITFIALLTDALDPDEYITPYDRSHILKEQDISDFSGMFSGGMDSNALALVTIRPEQEESNLSFFNLQELAFDEIKNTSRYLNKEIYQTLRENPLYLGFYAYRKDTETITDLYVIQGGVWPELLTEFIYDLYKDYSPHRRIPVPEFLEKVKDTVPIILTHVQINRDHSKHPMQVMQTYEFKIPVSVASIHFVPRAGSQKGQGDAGYILCTVVQSDNLYSNHHDSPDPHWSDNCEIWIFDAQHLSNGPLYKVSHPHLNFSLTLHSTWLEKIAPAPTQDYSFKQDYKSRLDALLKKHPFKKKKIQALFDEIDQAFTQYQQGK